MIDSARIRRAYAEAAEHFDRLIDDADSAQDPNAFEFQYLARMNDYAYFVLFWGQFELLINDTADSIDGHEAATLDLMGRVRICISQSHPHYQDLDQYYQWRCDLAHGRISALPNLIAPRIFDKIEKIAEDIRRGPLPIGEPLFDF